MGYMQSWVAVRGKTREAILEELRLVPTGEREEFPESDVTGAVLPGGWYVVVQNRDGPLHDAEVAARLSRGGFAVLGHAFEGPMYSDAWFFHDGVERWSVAHSANDGVYDLQESGDLPASYEEFRARRMHEQDEEGGAEAGVDLVFEVPLDLAHAVTGYRHDEDVVSEDPRPFEVLEPRRRRPVPRARLREARRSAKPGGVEQAWDALRSVWFFKPLRTHGVITILVLLALLGVGIWRVMKHFEPEPEPPGMRHLEMFSVQAAAESHWRKHGEPPRSVAELDLLEDMKTDAWHRPYQIAPGDGRRQIIVRCLGPDGAPGTPDDVLYPKNAVWPGGDQVPR